MWKTISYQILCNEKKHAWTCSSTVTTVKEKIKNIECHSDTQKDISNEVLKIKC